MLVETIKARMIAGMKSKNDRERDIMRFILGELQRGNIDYPTDEQVVKVIKKTIESNNITLKVCPPGDQRFTNLTEENVILTEILPKEWDFSTIEAFFLNHDEPLFEQIRDADKEGKAISGFQGENRFLSNFHPAKVELDGIMYPSSEAAYQAAKTLSDESRKAFVTMTPGESKRAGKKLVVRPDWDSVKILIMTNIVRDKFTRHEDLKQRLLATGDQELVEKNYWKDYFWGICNNKGENHLGKILMKVRDELRKGAS